MTVSNCFVRLACLIPMTAFVAACGSKNLLDELDQWDLVYISDSTGWGVAKRYAENIQRDTGKIVQVSDYATGGLSALAVLDVLEGDHQDSDNEVGSGSLRSDIAKAEVIVFFVNPRGELARGGVQGGVEHCISADQPPDDCSLELYEPYIENLRAVYENILALRMGKPTIIRATDLYNPLISIHRNRNMEDECTECVENFNTAVRQAAEAFNIPLVSIYDAFNGSNHNEDPREKGYIGADGIHASEEGRQVVADLLSAAGYEPIE